MFGIYSNCYNIVDSLMSSLERLEYRGYDSSGVAFIDAIGGLICHKAIGKLSFLKQIVSGESITSNIGIGHTRWATHGVPCIKNAHPILSERIAIVHNGVVENYIALKEKLLKNGFLFNTDTDTEIILLLVDSYIKKGFSPFEACFNAVKEIDGSFAVVFIFKDYKDLMIGLKKDLPLLFGYNDNSFVISSDVYALPFDVEQYISIDDMEMIAISDGGFKIYDVSFNEVIKVSNKVPKILPSDFCKSHYKHFMLKEIKEQSYEIKNTINFLFKENKDCFDKLVDCVSLNKRLTIIACGSSFFAGLFAKHWIEEAIDVSVNVELASEFCYRNFFVNKDDVFLFISQSGETADTISALRKVKSIGCESIFSIINIAESSLAKEAYYNIQTAVGPEISVASTKSFTAQIFILKYFSLFVALKNNTIQKMLFDILSSNLLNVPLYIEKLFNESIGLMEVANVLCGYKNIIFSGRGIYYCVSLESALKIKEISYIHAEAIPAGELKHGSMALIDNDILVVFINPCNKYFFKTISNIQEVAVRGANIVGITNKAGQKDMSKVCNNLLILSDYDESVMPIILTVLMQFLSYNVADLLGKDIDRPRNLAKSVTVE